MKTLKFKILKNTCQTDAQIIPVSRHARLSPVNSKVRDLAIVLEDKGSRSVYYAKPSKSFRKNDPLEFQKVWLEYKATDSDYEVELQVG